MSNSHDYAITLGELYRRWGLHPRVFHADEARKERKLAEVMKLPAWFFEVLGTVYDTDFLIVVGVRGAGKSALRRLIAQYCESKIASDRFLEGSALCVTIDHDVPYWARRAVESGQVLRAFSAEVADLIAAGIATSIDSANLRENLSESELAILSRFIGRLRRRKPEEAAKIFESTHSLFKRSSKDLKNLDIVQDALSIATGENMRAVMEHVSREAVEDSFADEDLVALAGIARSCGYDVIYVLVDEIDEYAEVKGDPRGAAELIAPILSSLRILEIDGIAFKFFLSEPVYGQLKIVCEERLQEIRWDRTIHDEPYFLAWSDADIAQMLEMRLRAYSIGEAKRSLVYCCVEELSGSVDESIIQFAYRSPRHFIKFAHRLGVHTARVAIRTNGKITPEILSKVKSEFSRRTCQELYKESHINAILRMARTTFSENEFVKELSLDAPVAQEVLLDLVGRGALRKTEEVKGTIYTVVDPRLKYLIETNVIGM